MDEEPWRGGPRASTPPLQPGLNGEFRVVLPRYDAGRDRLFSRWQMVRKTSGTERPASHARPPTLRGSLPRFAEIAHLLEGSLHASSAPVEDDVWSRMARGFKSAFRGFGGYKARKPLGADSIGLLRAQVEVCVKTLFVCNSDAFG